MSNIENFPNGINIYQHNIYKFTKDSIDLAKFCNIKPTDTVLELCAGCGVISFYAYALKKFKYLYLNEIQHDFCEILEKNIDLNNLNKLANVLEGDLKEVKPSTFGKKLDVIICNPPYYNYNGKDFVDEKLICKHEVCVNLNQIVSKASELIKDKGKFFICINIERSAELLGELYKKNFHAKRIKYTIDNNGPYVILVEAVFNGKPGTKVIIE